MKTRLAAVGAIAVVFGATLAHADTPLSGWDEARDPGAADRYALHLRVRELMANARLMPRDSALFRARALLERANAERSPDVRLRFDLGEIYALLEDNVRAKEVLRPAVDAEPRNPAAISAFIALANAYAKLDESADERRVYEQYLPLVTDRRQWTTARLNLSEADMHLGDLEAAIRGYRETSEASLDLPNQVELENHTGLLAHWGLAVALDRSGDIAGGGKEAKLAVELDHDMQVIRTGPGVFFSPERERIWYVALGFAEYAKQAEDARGSALLWHRAEECWREYINDVTAHSAKDRWIDLAHARLDRTHSQRVSAERRLKTRIAYPQYDCVR